MKNQLNESLIRINWLRLKSYAGKGLNLIRKLGEEILKTILKILTAILLGFLAVYKRFSGFGRSKQRGIWILILIMILLWMGVFVIQRERSHLNFLRETNQQYEELLNDYKELDSQIESLKDQPVDTENTDGHYSVENWRYLVVKYFPPEQVENAMAIMSCESGGDPK